MFPYIPRVPWHHLHQSFSKCAAWDHLHQNHGKGPVKIQGPWFYPRLKPRFYPRLKPSTLQVGSRNLHFEETLQGPPAALDWKPLFVSRGAWPAVTIAAQCLHLVASTHHCLCFANAVCACSETIKHLKKKKEIGTKGIEYALHEEPRLSYYLFSLF